MADVLFVPVSEKSTAAERQQAFERLLAAFDLARVVEEGDKIAVKTHFGEHTNTTHLSPALVGAVVRRVKEAQGLPFLTETSTLYKGRRSNALVHLELAHDHGFTWEAVGCPIVMADGLLGDSEIEVEISGEVYERVNIARDIVLADALVVVSHPTGHMVTAAGACLKNLGMGCASRKGKRAQHCSLKPTVVTKHCRNCKVCRRWCPQEAIAEVDGRIVIDHATCIGCGECLAVCRHDAISIDWRTDSEVVQKRIVEHALGVVSRKRGKCLFINALVDMTSECDCLEKNQSPVMADVGFALSTDPVALDQATLDLTARRAGKTLAELSHPALDATVQLAHAEKVGLGERGYRLVTVD
ncbi:MAG TPA: 4Fe-4S ferredoxin [Myxococcales bacterium]|jgi:hypothetical protein|nr:4Fe-4S ferredoxin [Myxococcales bacterium]